jgi:nucleoside-diphosphate-sugar epimerase
MCRHFNEDFNLDVRVVRYHNVYGPLGTFDGGREKAPAALCRKIAIAKINNLKEIEIWGDGEQTRSFMYIDDCIIGTQKVFESNVNEVLNLGSSEQVSINQLVEMIENISGHKIIKKYLINKPKGVRGRSSDNSELKKSVNWVPNVKLCDGLEKTYKWIFNQIKSGENTLKFTHL